MYSYAKQKLAGRPVVLAWLVAMTSVMGLAGAAVAGPHELKPTFPLLFDATPQQQHDLNFSLFKNEKERRQKSQQSINRLLETKPKTQQLLSRVEVNALYEETSKHPVVGISDESREIYDPEARIGFCFGRAEYVYRRALQMGASPESVVKIFVFGPLNSTNPDQAWNFHVATMIYTKGVGWVAVDTGLFLPNAVRLKDWVTHVNKYIAQRNWLYRLRALDFVVSTAERIYPDQDSITNVALFRDSEIEQFSNWNKIKATEEGINTFRILAYFRNMYRSLKSNEKIFKCELAFSIKP